MHCTRSTPAAVYLALALPAAAIAVAALTDGLLVLRYLFGFTGTTLTNGATGPNCSRCDGTAIAAYLAARTS